MSVDGDSLALVLSGGGSKGALQVGLYRALWELGVRPDFIVGASVGAVNGAFIAGGVGPRRLAEGWAETSRSDLFRPDWSVVWKGRTVKGLFSSRRFRSFLAGHVPVGTFDDLEIPLHVVSTHLASGEACRISEGDLREALHASCAVPGLLPPVALHDAVPHIDGSLGDNLPVSIARELGADRVQGCMLTPRRPSLPGTLRVVYPFVGCTSPLPAPWKGRGPDPSPWSPMNTPTAKRVRLTQYSHGAG